MFTLDSVMERYPLFRPMASTPKTLSTFAVAPIKSTPRWPISGPALRSTEPHQLACIPMV